MSTILPTLLAVPLYIAAGTLLALRLVGKTPAFFTRGRTLALAVPALILHAVALHGHLFTDAGIDLGFFNALSLLAGILALLLVVSATTQPTEHLGIAIFPVAAISMMLELLFPSGRVLRLGGSLLDVHVLFSVTAYAMLTLAAFQAVLLSVQERHLRERRPGGFIRGLPPMQSMERLMFQMLGAGFVLQSLSLATGFVHVEDLFAQHVAHKTFFAVAAWAVFAILLAGRLLFGWRGRVAIRWTLTGAAFLLLSYLGSKLVLELVLGG